MILNSKNSKFTVKYNPSKSSCETVNNIYQIEDFLFHKINKKDEYLNPSIFMNTDKLILLRYRCFESITHAYFMFITTNFDIITTGLIHCS